MAVTQMTTHQVDSSRNAPAFLFDILQRDRKPENKADAFSHIRHICVKHENFKITALYFEKLTRTDALFVIF